MDELVELVSQKTGIPKATAKVAVDTVLKFLEEKLPDPLGSQVRKFAAGADLGDLADDLGDLTKGLGSLLGK